MGIIDKIRQQPKWVRQAILGFIMLTMAIVLLFWWGGSMKEKSENFEAQEFEMFKIPPSLQEELENLQKVQMPDIEIPDLSEEDIKALEEALNEQVEQEEGQQ